MQCRPVDQDSISVTQVGRESNPVISIPDFLKDPAHAVEVADKQQYAKINPHYPGIRAPVPPEVTQHWGAALTPVINEIFGYRAGTWEGVSFFSIVTFAGQELSVIQRFPHIDGTSPALVALMLYLHHTDHGGTGFYRHKETGYESLGQGRYPAYATALNRAVEKDGLPPGSYVEDGAPYFERLHAAEGGYNEAILYRSNCLHTGLIDNHAALSPDPQKGRLTINGVFRPR